MGLYENMARLKEANLCNIVLVPSRLSASGRNKLHHHHNRYGVLSRPLSLHIKTIDPSIMEHPSLINK